MVVLYYRPMWTCGRFHAQTQSAIIFNLLRGVSYYFEDVSSVVIGRVLSAERGAEVDFSRIVDEYGLSEDELEDFCKLLEEQGLLSSLPQKASVIEEYRKAEYGRRQSEHHVSNSKGFFLNEAEKMYAERTGVPITTAMLELTYRCSERCVHCYNPGATRNDGEECTRSRFKELTLNEYKSIIDQLYDAGAVRVCLTGGDPFSKPEVWDIINYLYVKNIAIEIFTNGQSLVGKETELASFYPSDVGLSLYGACGHVHDRITRVKGSFERSLSVLRRLSELGVPIVVKCCVIRPNVKHYAAVCDLADSLGAFLQLETAVFDSLDGDKCVSTYLRLTEEQLDIVLRDMRNPLYVGPEVEDWGRFRKIPDERGCGAGHQTINISPEGNVTPCCSFGKSLGNLREESLEDILTGNDYLGWWKELTLKDYPECGKYVYCDFCKLCPGLNYNANGTPIEPSDCNCYIAKARYGVYEKLQRGIDPLNGRQLEEALSELDECVVKDIHRVYNN